MAGISIFAWKGQTDGEFEWCIEQTVEFGNRQTLNMIVDNGAVTGLVHEKYPEYIRGMTAV